MAMDTKKWRIVTDVRSGSARDYTVRVAGTFCYVSMWYQYFIVIVENKGLEKFLSSTYNTKNEEDAYTYWINILLKVGVNKLVKNMDKIIRYARHYR